MVPLPLCELPTRRRAYVTSQAEQLPQRPLLIEGA